MKNAGNTVSPAEQSSAGDTVFPRLFQSCRVNGLDIPGQPSYYRAGRGWQGIAPATFAKDEPTQPPSARRRQQAGPGAPDSPLPMSTQEPSHRLFFLPAAGPGGPMTTLRLP